ncbi:hypothetical protein JW877_10455 [bacterium]|nr:hypothetical protein [bacterium]
MIKTNLLPITLLVLLSCFSLRAESLDFIDSKYWSFTTDVTFSSDTSIYVAFKTGITEMILGINDQLFLYKKYYIDGNVLAMEKFGKFLYILTMNNGLFIVKDENKYFRIVDNVEIPPKSYIISSNGTNLIVGNNKKLYLFQVTEASKPVLTDSVNYQREITYADFDQDKLYITLADTIMKGFSIVDGILSDPVVDYKVPQSSEFFVVKNDHLFISNIIEGVSYYKISQSGTNFLCKISTPENFYSSLAASDGILALSQLDVGVELYNISGICSSEPLSYYENMKNSQKVVFEGSKIGLVNNEMGCEFLRYDEESGIIKSGEYLPNTSILDAEILDNYVILAAGQYGMPILEVSLRGVKEVSVFQPEGYVRDIYVNEDKAYITVEGVGISVVSLANPEYPQMDYNLEFENPFAVASNGNIIAFTTHGSNQLGFVKVSSSHYLESYDSVQSFEIEGFAREILIEGDYCYASCDRGGLYIFDISNPETITYARRYKTPSYTRGLHIVDSTLYLACGEDGINILNIANPMRIKEIAKIDIPLASDVSVAGNFLIASSDNEGCYLYDISDKLAPVFLDSYANSGLASKIAIYNSVVFMVDQYSLYILKISD